MGAVRQRPFRRFNVQAYGAVGDGSTNDYAAIKLAQAAVQANGGGCLYFPDGAYRITTTSMTNNAAVYFADLSDFSIEMEPGAYLLMDNLTSSQTVGHGHGIYIVGTSSNITLEHVRVVWNPAAAARSEGDGIRITGYPSDSGAYVKNVRIVNCEVVGAPQCGAIFHAVSDLSVDGFRAESTKADGIHFNACRRITASNLRGVSTGDDAVAIVTYYHASDVGSVPYNQPSLGDWSNSYSTITNVAVDGGTSNGIRITGAKDVAISNVSVKGVTSSGVTLNGDQSGGGYNWTTQAPQGITLDNVTVDGCDTGILAETGNATFTDNERYWKFRAAISNVTIRNCTNDSLHITDLEGISLANVRCYDERVRFRGARNLTVNGLYLYNGTLGVYGSGSAYASLAVMPWHHVTLDNIVVDTGSILFQDLRGVDCGSIRINDPQGDHGFIATRVTDMTLGRVHVANPAASYKAFGFWKVKRAVVDHVYVANTDTAIASAIDLYLGDATDVTEDIEIRSSVYVNTINSSSSAITVETGTYKPINWFIAHRYYNGGEASPVWRTLDSGSTKFVARFVGSGTPESAVTAPVGSTYQRTDGGTGSSMYVKESGTGNTGWVAK